MSWLVDYKISETCLRSDALVQAKHVKVPERIPMKCLDEYFPIRKYFTFKPWQLVTAVFETLRAEEPEFVQAVVVTLMT